MTKDHQFKPLENYIPSQIEEEMVGVWKKNKTFEKSVEIRSKNNPYTFYDGPPFITGLPHYGHLLGSIVKDVVPRYQTMKGKRVERVWGWDCHGLPAENKVEKELGINSKKEIETLGIGKFISACKAYVNNVSEQWAWYIDRIGRWVDFENAYKTMDLSYMESVMWVFKQLYEKKLIYKGKRVSLFCPRCSTPISNFEVAMDNSYKDITDPSVYLKFKLNDGSYLLAWTTTPWTLPSNFALAVDEKADYVKVEADHVIYILAEKRASTLLGSNLKIIQKLKGRDLVGLSYQPLFDYFKPNENDFKVYRGDFVTLDEGTGVVHIAPGFGEVDTVLGQKNHLSMVDSVTEEGHLIPEIEVAQNKFFKSANHLIIEDLRQRNLLFKEETITHSYPHCHRCATPLIYKAQEAWYIDIQSLKTQLLETNQEINWVPEYFKAGRFKLGIENAPDWCISRSRYWGSPIPVWETASGWRFVPGSIAELEKASGQKITDLHRPNIDDVVVKAPNGEIAHRVKEVLDSWVEAASMPYAERHYPFENEAEFNSNFPADFITEYTGQLRAWFYVMHVISNALYQKPCFKNCVVTGVILGTDGRKMSKNFGNYPDPKDSILKYGADSLRLYLMGSPIVLGQDISISETDWQENLRSVPMLLWNSYKFFSTYAIIDKYHPQIEFDDLPTKLDLWILTRLDQTVIEIDQALKTYQIPKSVAAIKGFISDLSTWYIRRSRDRIGSSASDQEDKTVCYTTLNTVFTVFLKAVAPIIPFLSDYLYCDLSGEESVHLSDWPEVTDETVVDKKLIDQMQVVRKICELGHAKRKESLIAVKQPLSKINVQGKTLGLESENELVQLIKDELNLESVEFKTSDQDLSVELDTNITPDLKEKGQVREVIRSIQEARKAVGCRLDEIINVSLPSWPKKYEDQIKQQTLVEQITQSDQIIITRR